MKHEIIYTEYYALILGDEQAKENDWGYIQFQGGDVKLVGKYFADDWKKIIAHRPLKDAEILQGVPLLPDFSEEDSIKDYSLDAAKEFALNHFNGLEPKYRKGGYITIKSILDVLKIGVECGHKFGLKQAKETYKYTEDDLIDFSNFVNTNLMNHSDSNGFYIGVRKVLELFKQTQQPKLPKYFEYEIKFFHDETIPYPKSLGTKPKTITNIKDQTELVGKYTF